MFFFFEVYLETNSHFAPETRPFALPPKKEKACLPFSPVFRAKPAVCFKESISTYDDVLMIFVILLMVQKFGEKTCWGNGSGNPMILRGFVTIQTVVGNPWDFHQPSTVGHPGAACISGWVSPMASRCRLGLDAGSSNASTSFRWKRATFSDRSRRGFG